MSVRKQVLSGTKWTTVGTIVIILVQILRLAILAHFLNKADFGVVAIITFVLGLTQVFGDLGFSAAVIHRKNVSNTEFSSLFWIQFLLFLFLYFILAFCSPLVADFYNEPSISYLMPVALLDLVFWGIGKLYDTILQKQMKFKVMAFRNIVSSILSLLIALVLAFLKFGIYSLIISTLFYTAYNNIWNFITGQNDYRVKLHLSLKEVKPFFVIGIFKTGTQILDYFSGRLDILIVGKIFGTELLGVYSLAKELVSKAISVINTIIAKVALPIFADNQNDIHLLRNYFLKMIRFASFINFPICAFMCIFSGIIVKLLYGSDYIEVAPLISLLTFYAMISAVSSPEGILVTAMGRTYLDFKWTVVRSIITPGIILLSSFYSLQLVIIGQIIIGIIGFVYVWKYIINKLIFLPLSEYIKSFFTIACISLIICFLLYFVVDNDLLGLKNVFFQLSVYGIFFVFSYIILMYIFMKSQIAAIKELFLK